MRRKISYGSRKSGSMTLIAALVCVATGFAAPYEGLVRTPADELLEGDRFHSIDRGIDISMRVVAADSLFESLLRIETDDKSSCNLILSRPAPEYAELLWIAGSQARRMPLVGAESRSDTLDVRFTLCFQSDSIGIDIGAEKYMLYNESLASGKNYRFLLPENNPQLQCISRSADLLSFGRKEPSLSSWYWFVLVILVDLLIFFGVHLRRRRQRRLRERGRVEIVADRSDKSPKVLLPRVDAVYLFGTLRVYDSSGEDVALRFSPLLRELFTLLLFRSVDRGISSEELTSLLWFDKDDSSARNNRAVNISKLRTLTRQVGGCTIAKEAGRWKIRFDEDTFVDYYECIPERLAPEQLTPERIRIIDALTQGGSLLADCDYLWLDAYKSRTADLLIESLLKYAQLLNEQEQHATKLLISDILFRFDSASEAALRIRCTTYAAMNRLYMAKNSYDNFCREYRSLYGEPFKPSFNDIMSRC